MFRAGYFGLVLTSASASLVFLRAHGGTSNPEDTDEMGSRRRVEVWRTAQNDGANCLYLLLHLSGQNAQYADVLQALQEQGNTIVGLREAARRLGLRTALAKGGLDELAREHLPAIIHLGNSEKNSGYFALVFGINHKECHVINGASATIEVIAIDQFRRTWSGYVLRPSSAGNGWILSLGGGMAAFGGYMWWRGRNARTKKVADR